MVKTLGVYPAAKLKNLAAQIALDNDDIQSIQAAIASSSISDTDKLILQQHLRGDQLDKTTNSQLLLLAKTVESPYVLAPPPRTRSPPAAAVTRSSSAR